MAKVKHHAFVFGGNDDLGAVGGVLVGNLSSAWAPRSIVTTAAAAIAAVILAAPGVCHLPLV
ncbi:hypothetical protein [Nocardia sp. CDC160]|uniref:hypothetical protein n=1 Tax=Nocardia sp. CDC160 TaxID=3112166 RepID=UPI002DBBD1B2|nr:hypothetical protein [Nocardia sp. CDC160]MEC3920311.1 hypothetical protein [Nocardia sp. CDC160]